MSRHPELCRTISPTDLDVERVRDLAAVMAAGGDPRTCELPPAARGLLLEVLVWLAEGHAVTLTAHEASLTTQEAADVLGVSRPTLVRLLEEGEIAYTQPGRHRRVRLHDVLQFQRLRTHEVVGGAAVTSPAPPDAPVPR